MPSLSIKLRNNPKILYAWYKVKSNIVELSKLDKLSDCVVLGSNCDVVRLIVTKSVVWHKSCRRSPKSKEGKSKKKMVNQSAQCKHCVSAAVQSLQHKCHK